MCARKYLCGSTSKETAQPVLKCKTAQHLAEIEQTWFLRIEEEGKNASSFRSSSAAHLLMLKVQRWKTNLRNLMTTVIVTLNPLEGLRVLPSEVAKQELICLPHEMTCLDLLT